MMFTQPAHIKGFFIIIMMSFNRFNLAAFFAWFPEQLSIFDCVAHCLSCNSWHGSFHTGVVNTFSVAHTHLMGCSSQIPTLTHSAHASYDRAKQGVTISPFAMIVRTAKPSGLYWLIASINRAWLSVAILVNPRPFTLIGKNVLRFFQDPMPLQSKKVHVAKTSFENYLRIIAIINGAWRIVCPPSLLASRMILFISLKFIHDLIITQWLYATDDTTVAV